MGKLAVGIISLLAGLIVGAIGALTVGGGAMAGVGIATGLSSGVCMTVEAAENLGLLTAAPRSARSSWIGCAPPSEHLFAAWLTHRA